MNKYVLGDIEVNNHHARSSKTYIVFKGKHSIGLIEGGYFYPDENTGFVIEELENIINIMKQMEDVK